MKRGEENLFYMEAMIKPKPILNDQVKDKRVKTFSVVGKDESSDEKSGFKCNVQEIGEVQGEDEWITVGDVPPTNHVYQH